VPSDRPAIGASLEWRLRCKGEPVIADLNRAARGHGPIDGSFVERKAMRIAAPAVGIVTLSFLLTPAWAQSPSPQRRTRPTPTPPIQVVVRDVSGTPLEGVNVAISSSGGRRLTTDASGTAAVTLADGTYRLRFECDGFITLERDVTVRNGRPLEIDVALNRAPLPPAPPAPQPVAPPEVPVATAGRVGPPTNISIPTFLDKNFVGRDPLKESILGCMPDATARLLQLRDAVAEHTHADLDEVLYVVAGDGAVRIRDESVAITPGSLTTIPRGIPHAIARRGKNPLIVLSTLAGAPCPTAAATEQSGRK
jgi:mannose-6-phosphate isomerase-like protein (cupin superfamily)